MNSSAIRAFFADFLNAPQQVISSRCFIYGGLLLTLLYGVISFFLLRSQDISLFKELADACVSTGLSLDDCHEEALRSAMVSVATMVIVLVITHLFMRTRTGTEVEKPLSLLVYGASILLLLILAGHYLVKAFGDVYISRLGAIEHEATFIALENMLWPLILQCLVITRSKKTYLFLLMVIFNNTVLTPFRGVLLAFMVFGIFIPLACLALSFLKRGLGTIRLREVSFSAGGVLIIAVLLWGMAQDSKNRDSYSDTANLTASQATPSEKKAIPDLTSLQRIEQRITYPFYQSIMAEYVSTYSQPPSLANEFLSRMHVPNTPTLNQMLYQRLYESKHGQTTFLFYGEGAAYSIGSPFFWCITAPLLLVTLYLILCSFGLPVGLLIGVAIWRASMSGLFNILPSLIVQIVIIISCYILQKLGDRYAAHKR